MYSILCVAFSLLLVTEAAPTQVESVPYDVNLTVSISLEDYLQDPSKIYLGEPFPTDKLHQFQLKIVRGDDDTATGLSIASKDYFSEKWRSVNVDIKYDCTIDDTLGLWSFYKGGSSFSLKRHVFMEVGFGALTWGGFWDVKNSLPDGDELKFWCDIHLVITQ